MTFKTTLLFGDIWPVGCQFAARYNLTNVVSQTSTTPLAFFRTRETLDLFMVRSRKCKWVSDDRNGVEVEVFEWKEKAILRHDLSIIRNKTESIL